MYNCPLPDKPMLIASFSVTLLSLSMGTVGVHGHEPVLVRGQHLVIFEKGSHAPHTVTALLVFMTVGGTDLMSFKGKQWLSWETYERERKRLKITRVSTFGCYTYWCF